jgi:hypothetical protein
LHFNIPSTTPVGAHQTLHKKMKSLLRIWPLLLCLAIGGCEGRNYGSKIFQSYDPSKTLVSIGKNRNLNVTLTDKRNIGSLFAGGASILFRYHTYSDVGNVELLAKEISRQLKKDVQDLGATIENSSERNGSFAWHYFNYKLNTNQDGSISFKATKDFQSTKFEITIHESGQTAPCTQ